MMGRMSIPKRYTDVLEHVNVNVTLLEEKKKGIFSDAIKLGFREVIILNYPSVP